MGKHKIRYDYNYLNLFCYENKVNLIKDYINEKINRNTRILGKCINHDCLNSYDVCFRELVQFLNFGCKDCRKKITCERRKQNCVDRFGVEHFMKVTEIKEKASETFHKNYENNHIVVNEKRKQTCLKKYGVEYPFQNEEVKQKLKNTMLEKYGVEHALQLDKFKNKSILTTIKNYSVEHPMHSDIVKQKLKNTCLEKYGFDCANKNEKIKQKIKNTMMEKYGVENPLKSNEIQNKFKKTCFEKYGNEYPIQNKEIKDKLKKTCLEKYGVEYPMQNQEIMEKSSKNAYNLKQFLLPSGNIIKLQGYEHYALKELLTKENISEDDIFTGCKNVPTIWYNDDNGKKHRHYVDIFIPSQNKCIEVKSTWTAKKKQNCIFLKQNAAKALGFLYELWIYDRKGNRVEIII